MREEQSPCLFQWLLSDSLAGRVHLYFEHNPQLFERHMNESFQVEAYQVLIFLHQKHQLHPNIAKYIHQ